MRLPSVGLIALLAIAPLASAGEATPDDKNVINGIRWRCRDGQPPTENVPCDIDGKADGVCTFGEKGGKSIRVRVGETTKVVNSCGVRAVLSCRAAR